MLPNGSAPPAPGGLSADTQTQTPAPHTTVLPDGVGQEEPTYKVVINGQGQYSLWPAGRANALGWTDQGKQGTKEECLDFIKNAWVDMRPVGRQLQAGKNSP